MASLLAHQMPRLLTADEFLQIDFGPDLKAELDNGYIRMMAGGTRDHARVQANLVAYLRTRLRGSGCRPYGSDMAVRPHDLSMRYPDVSVECGQPGAGDDRELAQPCVVVEILSPTTRRHDLEVKAFEYRSIGSLEVIAFVDPDTETVSVHRRQGMLWTVSGFEVDNIDLPSIGVVIPHAEVFARD